MSKARMVLLSLLAVIAVGAVSSATASAFNYKLEGKEIAKAASEEVEIQGQNVQFAFPLLGAEGKKNAIVCQELIGPPKANILEESGNSKFEFKLSNCFATESAEKTNTFPEKCVVEPFTLKGTGKLVGNLGQPEDELTLTEGNFEIAGCAALMGKYTLTGSWGQDFIQRYWPWTLIHRIWQEYWIPQRTNLTLSGNKEKVYPFAQLEIRTIKAKMWNME